MVTNRIFRSLLCNQFVDINSKAEKAYKNLAQNYSQQKLARKLTGDSKLVISVDAAVPKLIE